MLVAVATQSMQRTIAVLERRGCSGDCGGSNAPGVTAGDAGVQWLSISTAVGAQGTGRHATALHDVAGRSLCSTSKQCQQPKEVSGDWLL
jgi:hypothetical protein